MPQTRQAESCRRAWAGWACPMCGKRVYRHVGDRRNWLCKHCTSEYLGYTTRARNPYGAARNRTAYSRRIVADVMRGL